MTWAPGPEYGVPCFVCTGALEHLIAQAKLNHQEVRGVTVSRAGQRGPSPIPCMSCLSHRCSVSLSNKNSLSLSLSVGFFSVFSSVWFLVVS